MKNIKGFTLIEILIVVLIIGILAAIALPQYQKAVRRSRASEALTILNAILTGQEEYYLIHGEYTNNIEDLSIAIPSGKLSKNMSAEHRKSNYYYNCISKRTCYANIDNLDYPNYEFTSSKDPAHKGKRWCQLANGKNENARVICQMMGTVDSAFGGGNYYLLK